MFEVRRAVHIRTGQPAAAEAIDAWFSDHEVTVATCADVYEACVHLLREYQTIPEMVAVGTDWLAPDELAIVRYARDTWPRTVIVAYGAAADQVPDVSPLAVACRTETALRELLAATPAGLLERLWSRMKTASLDISLLLPAVPPVPEPVPVLPPRRPNPPLGKAGGVSSGFRADAAGAHEPGEPRSDLSRPAGGPTPSVSADDPPRSILTAEELSALLDASDRG